MGLKANSATSLDPFQTSATYCYICNGEERVLISLPTRYGGLAVPLFHETAEIEFLNSSKIKSELTAYDIIKDNLKKLKTEIKSQYLSQIK